MDKQGNCHYYIHIMNNERKKPWPFDAETQGNRREGMKRSLEINKRKAEERAQQDMIRGKGKNRGPFDEWSGKKEGLLSHLDEDEDASKTEKEESASDRFNRILDAQTGNQETQE